MRRRAGFLANPHAAPLIRALAAAASEDPDDADALYQQLTGPERERLLQRLRVAVAVGQVRADADLTAAADALMGAILYQVLVRDPSAASTRRMTGLLDVIMSGLRNTTNTG